MNVSPDDVSAELAELLRAGPAEFAQVAGHGWRLVRQPHEEHPDRLWFVAGDPPQVMIGVGIAEVDVAVPEVRWYVHSPELHPARVVATYDRDAVAGAAALRPAIELAERHRRASFRYCRYCRTLWAPEDLFEEDVCQDCATRHHGVVY